MKKFYLKLYEKTKTTILEYMSLPETSIKQKVPNKEKKEKNIHIPISCISCFDTSHVCQDGKTEPQ